MEKKRGLNWGVDEEVLVIEEVKLRAQKLFGAFKGSGIKGKGKEIKEKEWQAIADLLNSKFDTKKRTWEEVKKKYYNIKTRSKEKLDGIKHPKTGGGPPLPPLSEGEETFLRLAGDEPNVCGVPGGVDTDAPSTSEFSECFGVDSAQAQCSSMSTVSLEETAPQFKVSPIQNVKSTATSSTSTLSVRRKEKKGTDSRRRKLELEEKNLFLDNKRLEEEILKVKEERENLVLRKEVLQLKKQKLMFQIQSSFPCFLEQMSKEY